MGALVIRGAYSSGLTFEHADGRPYGSPAKGASVLATALELLVGLGFKHREAQSMIDRVRTHVGEQATVEDALRAALRPAPAPTSTRTAQPPSARATEATPPA